MEQERIRIYLVWGFKRGCVRGDIGSDLLAGWLAGLLGFLGELGMGMGMGNGELG